MTRVSARLDVDNAHVVEAGYDFGPPPMVDQSSTALRESYSAGDVAPTGLVRDVEVWRRSNAR